MGKPFIGKRSGVIIDPYTSHQRLKSRLVGELEKHGKIIIAVDFDDTVYDTHDNGWEYYGVIDTVKAWQRAGLADVICWTASLPNRYPFIRQMFLNEDIELDAINENMPYIEARGPKIYASIYLDDRSCGLQESITILNEILNDIKREKGARANDELQR